MKCESKLSKFCKGKAEKGLIINKKRVCGFCFNKEKEKNKK